MRTFLIACATAIILAVIGGFVLDSVQVPADRAFTTPYVRLGA
jgi:hypothetical protein